MFDNEGGIFGARDHNDTVETFPLTEPLASLVNSSSSSSSSSSNMNSSSSASAPPVLIHPSAESSRALFDPLSVCLMFVLVLFCVCAKPKIPAAHFRRGDFFRQRALEREARRLQLEKLADPAVRRQAIQNGLIVQQIIGMEDDCKNNKRILTLGDLVISNSKEQEDDSDEEGEEDDHHNDQTNQLKTQQSTDSNNDLDDNDDNYQDEDNACVICLEPFRVNDAVAWSRKLSVMPQSSGGGVITADVENAANASCQHVFHRECIESWLMNTEHDDCPSCRTVLIHPPDDPTGNDKNGMPSPTSTATTNDSMMDMQSDTSDAAGDEGEPASIAFVIINGLVSRVRDASYSLVQLARTASFGYSQSQDDDAVGSQHKMMVRDTTATPPPSTFRRVLSLGDQRLVVPSAAAAADVNKQRRRSFNWRQSAAAVAADPNHHDNMSSKGDDPIRRVLSSTLATTTTTTPTTTKKLEPDDDDDTAALTPTVSFRRCVSSSSSSSLSSTAIWNRRRYTWVHSNNNTTHEALHYRGNKCPEPNHNSMAPTSSWSSWIVKQEEPPPPLSAAAAAAPPALGQRLSPVPTKRTVSWSHTSSSYRLAPLLTTTTSNDLDNDHDTTIVESPSSSSEAKPVGTLKSQPLRPWNDRPSIHTLTTGMDHDEEDVDMDYDEEDEDVILRVHGHDDNDALYNV